MRACEACGSALPPGDQFCPVCAAPVPEAPEPARLAPHPDDVVTTPAPASARDPEPTERRESWWRRLTGSRRRDAADSLASLPPPAGPPVAVSGPPPAGSPAPPPAVSPASAPVEIAPEPGPIIAAVPGFSRPAEEPRETAQEPAIAPSPPEPAEDVDRTRLASPAERGPVVLELPGGERLTVTGDGVLGRNPAARVGVEVAHLVPVADPTRSVSKTHLGFGLDTIGLWVEDLHSTNGTAVVSVDGTRTPLTPGLAVHVAPGDVVVVGDVHVAVGR